MQITPTGAQVGLDDAGLDEFAGNHHGLTCCIAQHQIAWADRDNRNHSERPKFLQSGFYFAYVPLGDIKRAN